MPLTLPIELWTRVLSRIAEDQNERPKLWVSGRAVSTAFKEAIETIFRDRHLPKTFIEYDLGTHYLDNDLDNDLDGGPNKVVLTPEFHFSHLSADKSIAFFIDSEVHAKYKPLLISNLRFALEMKRFEKPPHTVQVRRGLNDTPIPGLEIDYDTMTLGCDWRGLFSAFFTEELLVNDICDRALEALGPRREALIAEVQAGRMGMIDAMQRVLKIHGDETDEARKRARRLRIRRQYEADGFSGWKPLDGDAEEEDNINKALKERIFYASMQEFSDDGDDDEGDGEGEEEGDEDEEWEEEEEEGEDGDDEAIEEETGGAYVGGDINTAVRPG